MLCVEGGDTHALHPHLQQREEADVGVVPVTPVSPVIALGVGKPPATEVLV
jgi:hypothetical protein